jgi:hypothetical protein
MNNEVVGAIVKHESNKIGEATKKHKKNTKDHRGEAKLASFCKTVGSFLMKLMLKEVLKKPWRGVPPTTQTKN